MNRLRYIANDYLLPLVIGALALRALIPMGFMPARGPAMGLSAAMCNPAGAAQAESAIEIIEIPATPLTGAAHCDYCLLPAMAVPPALAAAPLAAVIHPEPVTTSPDAPHSRFALQRAQIPRAPPLA